VEIVVPPPVDIEYDDYFYLKDGILRMTFTKVNDPDIEFTVTDVVFVGFDGDSMVSIRGEGSDMMEPSVPWTLTRFRIHDKDFPNFSCITR